MELGMRPTQRKADQPAKRNRMDVAEASKLAGLPVGQGKKQTRARACTRGETTAERVAVLQL